jgi:hypothetical protein
MKNLVKAGLILAAWVTGIPAWASFSNCPTVTPVTLAVINSNVPAGCQQIDVQFTNFAVGTLAPGTVIDGLTLPASTVTVPTASDITLLAQGTAGPPPSNVGVSLNDPAGSTNPWFISGKNQVLVSTTTYTAQVDPSSAYLLNQVSLSGTVTSHANQTTSVVFEEVCLGVATFNCTSSDPNYLVLRIGVIQGNNISLTQTVNASFLATNLLAIRDTVFLQTMNGQGSDATASQVTGFAPTQVIPEPSTSILLGTALAGLGFLRYRRKK